MQLPDTPLWLPPSDWRTTTLLGELSGHLNVDDYWQLLSVSNTEPSRYWAQVMEHLDFRWRLPYGEFLRTPMGPPFPRWFSGGRLNWVDSALHSWDREQDRTPVVVSEDESGFVETLTAQDLRPRVLSLAGGLLHAGVRPGDRVGLMMAMGIPSVLTFLAIAAIGAVVVPLFSGFAAEAAAARLRLSGAKMLIASSGFSRRGRWRELADTLRSIQALTPDLKLVVEGVTSVQATAWSTLASNTPISEPKLMSPDDPFMIAYTSGTTGQPKGTVHTHAGFPLKILHDSAYHFELRQGDRWFWPSDMGWVVGPITIIGALVRGATLVCYAGAHDFPTPSRIAELIDRHQITHFGASPTLLRSLKAVPESTAGARLDSLRLLMLAGEVIDPEHFEWFFREFAAGSKPIINYTGGTEASGALLANVPVLPIKSCGFNSPSPGVNAFVADLEGRRVQQEVGELVIGSPFIGMTQSFWGEDERYVESYWSQREGLWSHGDLAFEDAEGHFFILGRSDDTLKIAGKRVGPAEVEAIALELPQVKDVAAVGLADPIKGQRLVMCVVAPFDGGNPLAQSISARVEDALGIPFRPSEVIFLNELPRTRNGKVMRRVIRNLLQGQSPGDLTALDNRDAVEKLKFEITKLRSAASSQNINGMF
jgi:acetyl-CoA synthetase